VELDHNPEFLNLVNSIKGGVTECSIEDYLLWKSEHKTMVLIDVREDIEWSNGHAPQAVHLGKGVIERDIETVYPSKDVCLVLYCGGGFRSAMAADSIQKMGYSDVTSMDGGFRRWLELGLEVQMP